MKRFLLLAMLSGLGGTLSGCTSQPDEIEIPWPPHMEQDVMAEHQPELLGLKGKSVAILPRQIQGQYTDPPLSPAYLTALETNLARQGFVISHNPRTADLVAMASYFTGSRLVETYKQVPIYSQTSPGGTAHVTGSVNTPHGWRPFDGTADIDPTYGITGYSTYTLTDRVYERSLQLILIDNRPDQPATHLYEGIVRLTSHCTSMPVIYPYLINAMFKGWPGPTGGLQSTTLPMPDVECTP